MIFPEVAQMIRERALPDGGFAGRGGGEYMPDATAWAIMALTGSGAHGDVISPARSRLAVDQLDDGRVSISPEHPEGFWTTPLAILAWQGASLYREQQTRAIRFLLETTGRHWIWNWKRISATPLGHDPSIQGWPWISNTHSMVEPTATSILALRVAGYEKHKRVREAVRMLLDRQLRQGGWNYGNTIVYGKELHPFPDTTGIALNALSGLAPRDEIRRSLEYLEARMKEVRTPRSLGWGLLGLHAWGIKSPESPRWINETLNRQKMIGPYDTCSLCLLLLANLGNGNPLMINGSDG
jgi:hypothetical protein